MTVLGVDTQKRHSYSEWLVIRCQQGERKSLNALLKIWRPRYFLYAVNRLREQEVARDVTQEALISISRGIADLTDPGAFPKWSFTIVERRCIDWQRKASRENKYIQQQENPPEIPIEDKNTQTIVVNQLLAHLDPRISAILRLYYLEELSIADICEIKNLAPGTVKSRLFYGRKLMAAQLENNHE